MILVFIQQVSNASESQMESVNTIPQKDQNNHVLSNGDKESNLNPKGSIQNHCLVTYESKKLIALFAKERSKPRTCGRKRHRASSPMQADCRLMQVAQIHANDLNDHQTLSHQGSDNSSVGDRAKRAGFDWAIISENIAQGQKTENEVLTSWLESPAHCNNIMNSKFDKLGVGRSGDYWVAVFAHAQ